MMVPNLFADFKLGKPKPWKAIYRGIEYPGEILLADTWRPELGEIAGQDVHFRIVVFTKYQQVSFDSIVDRRIAFCIPSRQCLAIKEKGEDYRVGKERKAAEPLREQAAIYAAGRVLTKERLPIDAQEVFSAPDNERRFQIIAATLLSNAYASLPVCALKKTLSPSDVGKIFDGFFGKGDNPEAETALENFAVALGLAKPENPYKLAPQNCPIFATLAERLEERDGSLPIPEPYRELSSRYGLIWALITLYLLCFVYYKKPAVELRLKPEHILLLRSGEKPPGARLTATLIPQIWWISGIEEAFDSLCYSGGPSWNALLPYARLLCEEFKLVASQEEVVEQEILLLKKLDEIKTTIAQIEGGIDLLSTRLGWPPESMLRALGRLSHIAQSKDSLAFYALVQEDYDSLDAFAEDISQFRGLSPLIDIAGEVLAIKSYLDGVVLRESDVELAMDRVSILEQLTLDNLLPNLHLWPSLKALFEWFQSRYRAIYLAHHHDYHREMASLHLVLDDTRPEVDALRRLNSIIELGEPLDVELVSEYEQLLARVSPCPVTEVSVEFEPICSQCGLALTAEPPQEEVERFLHRLEKALRQQQRRLSSEAVRQIFAQNGERQIDQFIRVVQASELSPLVSLLDDELVDFLRKLLQEAQVDIPWHLAFTELMKKFPSLEEGDIDAMAAETVQLLRRAFAKAKREHPGKRVRLIFKE
ncbi:MAG: hypothetical protein IBX36_01110 [Dehalococcoidia bacterium]|nr:hypothetical protein [Dehalococcoidia bacterium]